ncbi:HDOD domain-containing protein [bacterium]|nr:HDOD domain-containing protein [bacterium]MBU1989901.1 HDOD domain-containing protein [bacterium]
MAEVDFDLLDLFINQFDNQIDVINVNVSNLQYKEEYSSSVNHLFRIFHNYKSTTSYLGLDSIRELVIEVEDVLEAVRAEEGPAEVSIRDWLGEVYNQLIIWQDEMREGLVSFSDAPESLLKGVKLTPPTISIQDRLKTLSILYIDENKQRAQKVVSALSKIAKDVEFQPSFLNLHSLNKPDICLLNAGKTTIETIKAYQNDISDSAIIVILDKTSDKIVKKLIFNGVNHLLFNPLRSADLKRELYNVTESHFSNRRVLIDNKKIQEFIHTLEPLPNSIFQIQQICDDEEMGIKELIKVVKSDPIITGNILNATNNPIYGLKNINTIDQAVSIFGKKTLKALVLSGISKQLGNVELGAYGINEDTFSRVANLRLSLMIKWYSKVSIAALGVLSVSAILSNLGQLLLAKEIKRSDKLDLFIFEALEHGFQKAEEKIFHTTTASVCSDILKFWKLNSDIIDSIRYSDNPQEAPIDIHQCAVANHIVFNIVLLNGTIRSEIPKEILSLMEEENLNVEPLINAIKYIS